MAGNYPNCQFCDEPDVVKWHCKSCNKYLCDLCNTKIHTKLEKLSEHKLVLLQHGENIVNLENLKQVDLKGIACSKHTDQTCVSYCLNCDKSVCSSCLIRPFQYEKLNQVYEEKHRLLEDLKRKIDACYPFFEEQASKFRKMDDDEVKKQNEIKEKISNRKNEVKDAVTREAFKLGEVMKGIWDPENNPVVTERKRLFQTEQDLMTRKNSLGEVLETQDPASVFETAENARRDMPEEFALKIEPPGLVYVEPKQKFMKEVLGSIIKIPKVVISRTFYPKFPEISGLVSLNDDIYVMFNRSSSRFVFFTISNSNFVTTNDIKEDRFANISDITTYKGDILLTDNTFEVRRLRRNGQFEELSLELTKDDATFYGIHARDNNDISLSFTNSTGSSAGIIGLADIRIVSKRSLKYTASIMRRFEGNCKTLFTIPKKITRNINGYICVIDQLSYCQEKGRVVVIGEWGQPKWIYNGHPSINLENEFSPIDIITSSSGLVLVAEKKTNAIHVLSQDGQFICNCISNTEITEPVSMCFNKKGQLMIGCFDSGRTKLHLTNFIE